MENSDGSLASRRLAAEFERLGLSIVRHKVALVRASHAGQTSRCAIIRKLIERLSIRKAQLKSRILLEAQLRADGNGDRSESPSGAAADHE